MKAENDEPSAKGEYVEMTIPYYFSSLARAIGLNLKIGDLVRLPGMNDKYELIAIIRRRNSVRVRAIGRTDQLYLPWWHVRPWKEEYSK
jgi:hypothetical protein